MRQFGMQQHQTQDVEPVERIDARGKPGINWLEHHHAHIEKWGRRFQLVVTEEHKPEHSSPEDQEPIAHNTQGQMEQDLINLCCRLRGRLNEHLLACTKPSLVYKMLADIDNSLYGLHHMLSTRECITDGPSLSSSWPSCSMPLKASPDLQSSIKRPLISSSSSQLPLHPPAFSALPAIYPQNRREQMQAQQPLSLLLIHLRNRER